jgi:hypothetical protein
LKFQKSTPHVFLWKNKCPDTDARGLKRFCRPFSFVWPI